MAGTSRTPRRGRLKADPERRRGVLGRVSRRPRAAGAALAVVAVLGTALVVGRPGGTAPAPEVLTAASSPPSAPARPPDIAAPPAEQPSLDQPCAGPAVPPPGAGQMRVTVYYHCEWGSAPWTPPTAVARNVPVDRGVLRETLEQLVAGPSDEETGTGLASPFSATPTVAVRGVSLTAGELTVDLSPDFASIPGLGTTHLSGLVITELNATVFHFPQVRSVSYRVDGSTTAWCRLHDIVCEPVTRAAASG